MAPACGKVGIGAGNSCACARLRPHCAPRAFRIGGAFRASCLPPFHRSARPRPPATAPRPAPGAVLCRRGGAGAPSSCDPPAPFPLPPPPPDALSCRVVPQHAVAHRPLPRCFSSYHRPDSPTTMVMVSTRYEPIGSLGTPIHTNLVPKLGFGFHLRPRPKFLGSLASFVHVALKFSAFKLGPLRLALQLFLPLPTGLQLWPSTSVVKQKQGSGDII